MKLPAYEKDWEVLKAKSPGDIRAFYPRRIACPNGYVDPKYYALVAWAGAAGIRLGPSTHTKATALATINQFLNLDCPTYFIAPEFAMAINATKPPEDVTIAELHFPMESMLFVLPMEFIQATYKWMIPFISVARLPKGTHVPNPHVIRVGQIGESEIGCEGAMFAVHCPFFPADGMGISYGGWYPADFSIGKIADTSNDRFQDDLSIQKAWYSQFDPDFANKIFHHDSPIPTGDEDKGIPNKFTMLALKIIMAMVARPQFVTNGSQTRKEIRKQGQVIRDALWSPHFVGKDYRIRRERGESLGGTHASPKVHWRMGHWHTVLHGKGRALRRLDWFEPVLVNAAEKENEP